MSTIKVDTVKNRSSAINLPNNFKIGGLNIIQGYTSSGSEPGSPSTGDFWWDSTNEKLYRYIDGGFKELGLASSAVGYGDRGFSIGGASARTQIDYWDMTSSSNAADFGDLATSMTNSPLAGGSTMFAIGSSSIESFNPATLGNASSYASHHLTSPVYGTAQSNGSIVIHAVGQHSGGTYSNNISQFNTTGGQNATDFGDLTQGRNEHSSCSNGTRFVCMGGTTGPSPGVNTMDYVTFDTPGNATDFGDMSAGKNALAGCGTGEGDRGLVMGGGSASVNVIEYITVSTTGNMTDFGDLQVACYYNTGCHNATKAHSVAGFGSSAINNIQQVVMATTGNATDHGDLTHNAYYHRASSGAAS